MRSQDRKLDELRPLTFEVGFTGQAPGSVLVRSGRTTVLCTCCIDNEVPPFLEGTGKGWLTAEYSMLPGSTSSRKVRDRGVKVDGRTVEIQRLIGRSLRSITHLARLGEHTYRIDCDVLEADGGTRTAAINGAYVALVLALRTRAAELPPMDQILQSSVAAVSVGLIQPALLDPTMAEAQPVEMLDLEYREDRIADVDLNLIMTGSGRFVEVQAGGEEATFDEDQLHRLLALGGKGIEEITRRQQEVLG